MESYLIFSSILSPVPPLVKGCQSAGRWKSASKEADFFTRVRWPLIRFLLITVALLDYAALYKEVDSHRREGWDAFTGTHPPSLQVSPFINLKSAPKTLGTSAITASDYPGQFSPPLPPIIIPYTIYK